MKLKIKITKKVLEATKNCGSDIKQLNIEVL